MFDKSSCLSSVPCSTVVLGEATMQHWHGKSLALTGTTMLQMHLWILHMPWVLCAQRMLAAMAAVIQSGAC